MSPKPVILEDTDPDLYIMIRGFPATKEEALELGKLGYGVSGVMIVTETSEFGHASKDGEEPPAEDDLIPASENAEVFKQMRVFEHAKR